MSLVCYLTRRACSQFIAQELPLPKGSRIESHVANCAGCREYVRELSSLTMDLDRHLSIPVPEMRFIEPIWERVKPSPRPARWSGLSLAGAAVCGLASHYPAESVAAQRGLVQLLFHRGCSGSRQETIVHWSIRSVRRGEGPKE